MDNNSTEKTALRTMIADYMENGFLENIVDMFLHDPKLYDLIGDLIQDERVRVRIGITALIEDLALRDKDHVATALTGLLPLLKHREDYVRGDATNLIGIIGSRSAVPQLRMMLKDKNQNVRTIAEEAIREIEQQ